MKTPTHEDAEMCISIRKRSKRGEYLSPHDSKFIRKLLDKYPEWYKSQDPRIFNETVPFGSNARMLEDGKIVYD